MYCPGCGIETEGPYCPQCGTHLGPATCHVCGHVAPMGSTACPECRSAVVGPQRAQVGQAPPRLPWLAAGALLLAVTVTLVSQVETTPSQSAPSNVANSLTLGPAPYVDLSTMTPTEAGERLFRRVMGALSAGDSQQARQFLPMAVGAYALVDSLGPDELFHLSLLKRAGGDFIEALATAERGLAEAPQHLLLLGAASEASLSNGDAITAARHAETLIRAYPDELGMKRQEYSTHQDLLVALKGRADALMQTN